MEKNDRNFDINDYRMRAESVGSRHRGGHGYILRRRRFVGRAAMPGTAEEADWHHDSWTRVLRRTDSSGHRRLDWSRKCWWLKTAHSTLLASLPPATRGHTWLTYERTTACPSTAGTTATNSTR